MNSEEYKQQAFPSTDGETFAHDGMTLLDYFAAKAMIVASSERQETVPASFWDYIKMLLVQIAHMHFLEVKYKHIKGVKEQIAESAYLQAAAMMEERKKYLSITGA